MYDIDLLNKTIMFTLDSYITGMKNNDELLPPILDRLYIALAGMKHTRSFTLEQSNVILDLAKHEEILELTSRPVSHLIFVLELVKLWVKTVPKDKRPLLNINDKKLSVGKSIVSLDMIRLKHKDVDKYDDKKNIIKDSEEVAKDFLEWHIRMLNVKHNS